jgi:hypothetical protein
MFGFNEDWTLLSYVPKKGYICAGNIDYAPR